MLRASSVGSFNLFSFISLFCSINVVCFVKGRKKHTKKCCSPSCNWHKISDVWYRFHWCFWLVTCCLFGNVLDCPLNNIVHFGMFDCIPLKNLEFDPCCQSFFHKDLNFFFLLGIFINFLKTTIDLQLDCNKMKQINYRLKNTQNHTTDNIIHSEFFYVETCVPYTWTSIRTISFFEYFAISVSIKPIES